LQRVLDGNRSDLGRLQQRLKQLVASWDGDTADEAVDVDDAPEAPAAAPAETARGPETPAAAATPAGPGAARGRPPVPRPYAAARRSALPADDARAEVLSRELRDLQADLQREGAISPLLAQAEDVCARARRLLAHRHHLVDELHRLTQEMSAGLGEFAE